MKRKTKILFLMLLLSAFFLCSFSVRADWTYTVKRGDTLSLIAKKCGITANQIMQRNGLNSSYLRIGQRIIIPTGVTDGGNETGVPTRVSGDADLLARLIFAEAGSEPYLGQVAVGGVVLNRVQSSKFPKTIPSVIYQPKAFESVSNGLINKPASEESKKAARDALGGWDPSGGALFFWNPSKPVSPWIWGRQIINRIGRHVFAL